VAALTLATAQPDALKQGFPMHASPLKDDAEMKNIVLADATARDQAIRHFFGRAPREARE
jgi:hypothetical protein